MPGASDGADQPAGLTDFRRWRAWSPFEELDPDMQRTYVGEGSR